MRTIDTIHRQKMSEAISAADRCAELRPRWWLAKYGSLGFMQHMKVGPDIRSEYRTAHNRICLALKSKGVDVPQRKFSGG